MQKTLEKQINKKMKYMKVINSNNQRGITLLALVITIIIVIILATVAISFLFGENGLITQAQKAKLEHEIATARETLTMILGDAFVEKKTNPEYDQNEFLDNFIKEREPDVYLDEDEIGLDGHVFSLNRSVPELGEYIGEQTGPRIKEIKVTEETTNSVSIEVSTINATGAEYTYSYKKDSEGEESWQEVETSNNNTCTIIGLTQGETYNVKVVVTTKDGSAEGVINVYLGEIPTGTITFTNLNWVGDGTASVQINTTAEGYTLQYQINSTEGSWTNATNGESIEGLTYPSTVYGRLWDGTNESDYATLSLEDDIAPEVNVTGTGTTSNSVSVSVATTDNESGMVASPTYTYCIKQSGQDDSSYTTPGDASNLTTNTYTFTGLTQGTSYDVKVEVNGDKAGNIGAGTLANQTTGSIPGGETGVEQGAITFGNIIWSDGVASVTISTNTSYIIQYQVNSTEGTWNTIGNGGTVSNLNHNYTVYARLWDGTNYGEDASITIKDITAPTVSLSTSDVTHNSAKVTVTANDGETGLATSETYKYYLNDESTPRVTSTSNSYTFTGLSAETPYTIKVDVIDKAGNVATKTTTVITSQNPNSIENRLKAGDYVKYLDGTGTTRTCVVLWDSTSKYGVQIITIESVGQVTLGFGDTTVNGSDDFTRAMNSYNNAISTLNSKAAEYNNSTYSSGARCVGSVPDNPNQDNAGYYTFTEFNSSYSGQLKDLDENYLTDYNQMNTLGIKLSDYYWLASRVVFSHPSSSEFNVRIVNFSDELFMANCCWVYSNGATTADSPSYALYPVFTLKSNINVNGGSGTLGDPYILGT